VSALDREYQYMSSSPKALSENLILYTSSFFENTAKVIVPSAATERGKIVLNLGSPRPEARLVSRDLLDPAGNFAVNAPASKVAYPLDPATQINATDNQIIRLQDGSLLAAKNGYIWSDVSPRPEWFDTGNFQYGQNLFSPRARNAVYLFRSTDAGQSWVLWSMIDAAIAANGKYGWPQPNKGPTGFGIGGFDRCQLYQDPWNGDIYVSGHGDGGPYTLNGKTTENHAGVIFRSQDNGKTWPQDPYYVFDDPDKRRWEFVMVSTLRHRLIVLSVESLKPTEGYKPTLYYVDNETMSAGTAIIATDQGKALNYGSAKNLDDLRGYPVCIARNNSYGDLDSVWVAYPSVNASGMQTYVVATVTFSGTSKPKAELVANVTAEDPTTTSATMGAFVYDDLVDPDNQNTDPSCTLFYWVDAPPKTSADKDKLLARYQVFHSGQSFAPGYLSVSNGAKRYFARTGIGDYFSGAYFWWGNELNFLAQWNEPDGIKANIVSLAPFPKINIFDYKKELLLDPTALLLSSEVFVRLTFPDPQPLKVLRTRIKALVHELSIAKRRAVLANLERIQAYAKTIATQFKKYSIGKPPR
jgi:hypothetical protein